MKSEVLHAQHRAEVSSGHTHTHTHTHTHSFIHCLSFFFSLSPVVFGRRALNSAGSNRPAVQSPLRKPLTKYLHSGPPQAEENKLLSHPAVWQFGQRSFGTYGPATWNDMPACSGNRSFNDFKHSLKTVVFFAWSYIMMSLCAALL